MFLKFGRQPCAELGGSMWRMGNHPRSPTGAESYQTRAKAQMNRSQAAGRVRPAGATLFA